MPSETTAQIIANTSMGMIYKLSWNPLNIKERDILNYIVTVRPSGNTYTLAYPNSTLLLEDDDSQISVYLIDKCNARSEEAILGNYCS